MKRQPTQVKRRKQQKGSLRGFAKSACFVEFGECGIIALDRGRIDGAQMESVRVAISREIKKFPGGKSVFRIFPHKPVSKKPAEVRMGKGKGAPDNWVAQIRPGQMLVELINIPVDAAKRILGSAESKLPIRTKFVQRQESV